MAGNESDEDPQKYMPLSGRLLDGVCKAVQTGTPLDELEKEGCNPEETQSAASCQEWTQLHHARVSARLSPREVRCGRGRRRRAFSGVGLQYDGHTVIFW